MAKKQYTCGQCGSNDIQLIGKPDRSGLKYNRNVWQDTRCNACGDEGVVAIPSKPLPSKVFKWFEGTPHELKKA